MHSLTQPPLITLTTDFGANSHYVAQMKGVILGICRQAVIVDVNHAIAPQCVAEAAWVITRMAAAFPADTCHVVVVDPGVGTDRDILLLRVFDQYFIAPDNGLMWPLCQQSRPDWVRRLTRREFWADHVSRTFHGRDIMAPVAAYLGSGVGPDQFGPCVAELCSLPLQVATGDQRSANGQIVHIDSFGNLITNLGDDVLNRLSAPLRIQLPARDLECHEWVATYGERPAGTLVALLDSHGQLEIAEVGGSAARRSGAQLGDFVRVEPVAETP